eukprot:Rmarinus@m.24312
MNQVSRARCFDGEIQRWSHQSETLQCQMNFHVFLPASSKTERLPVLYFLSGLTCTDENFIQKAGAARYAAARKVVLVCPDTSPRGHPEIEGENDSWDFGTGAGFYVNATETKWSKHYRMYDYVTKELPAVINGRFNVDPDRRSVFGHSMGGHGALICALKNPGLYKSVSAFAPICNPVDCPWGHKAFTNYLGSIESGKEYDACELVAKYTGPYLDILVDQGTADSFLTEQLKPEALQAACAKAEQRLTLRMQEGYDHSYWFIQSFVEDHINHHAKYLHA